jgi:hypothetical protein
MKELQMERSGRMNSRQPETRFTDFLSSVRKRFRGVVLPVREIKTVCRKHLSGKPVSPVLDFGSGTLFWSEWFVHEFDSTVCAVDPYYKNANMPEKEKIFYYSDIRQCFEDYPNPSLVWACDVLHHLSKPDYTDFLDQATRRATIIIIKDIDRHHTFGNFMNRMHDKIINQEDIQDIDPDEIKDKLTANGFETFYYYLPKLWYPHFILAGIKKETP